MPVAVRELLRDSLRTRTRRRATRLRCSAQLRLHDAADRAGFTATAHPQPYYGYVRRTVHIDQTGAVRYTWSDVQSEKTQ